MLVSGKVGGFNPLQKICQIARHPASQGGSTSMSIHTDQGRLKNRCKFSFFPKYIPGVTFLNKEPPPSKRQKKSMEKNIILEAFRRIQTTIVFHTIFLANNYPLQVGGSQLPKNRRCSSDIQNLRCLRRTHCDLLSLDFLKSPFFAVAI